MRSRFLIACAFPMLALAGCGSGDGGGSISSTPTPPPSPAPTPAPTPTPTPSSLDTAEYRRSNAAVQAQALAAYNTGASGRGITAAVIDSGIDLNSAEFAGRISGASADLAGNRGLQDPDGHGTAVASVLLGARNGLVTQGIAPEATLLVARTDTPGTCTPNSQDGCSHNDNNIARGVDLAIANGARVINMSLGGSPANATLRAAIGRATAAGIVIVISAGNDGVDNPAAAVNPDPFAQLALDPVARGLILIAGATDSTQRLADFSNRAGIGQQFYLTALGSEVLAPGNDGRNFLWSGTSFSTPVISGAVALLAQAFPNLTGAQIVDLLLRTATDLGPTGIDGTFGRGELNLARAFAPQGQASLETTRAVVSLVDNGTLSPAMGDAGQRGALTASIRDGYDRAYSIDLAPTLRPAPSDLRLSGALSISGIDRAAALGNNTTLALTVADPEPQRLLLSRDEVRMARGLAASITQRLDARTQVALGFASSSTTLDRALGGVRTPAFLVANGDAGLQRAPLGAFAMRHRLVGIDVTIAAESGDLRLWQRGEVGPRSDGYRRFGYDQLTLGADVATGPLELSARLTRMGERDTILGARFGPALGAGGAASWFADAGLRTEPLSGWAFAAAYRRGWTHVAAGSLRGASTIVSDAYSLDLTRTGLLNEGDSFGLRWSQPLRVIDGGLRLTGLGEATLLDLAPSGQERDLEVVYARALGPGWLTLNAFWRQEPGNIAAAPDDLGGALRYRVRF